MRIAKNHFALLMLTGLSAPLAASGPVTPMTLNVPQQPAEDILRELSQ